MCTVLHDPDPRFGPSRVIDPSRCDWLNMVQTIPYHVMDHASNLVHGVRRTRSSTVTAAGASLSNVRRAWHRTWSQRDVELRSQIYCVHPGGIIPTRIKGRVRKYLLEYYFRTHPRHEPHVTNLPLSGIHGSGFACFIFEMHGDASIG